MRSYINEIKAFQELVQDKSLSAGQIALWYALAYVNNKCYWTEWFTVASRSLESNTGLSRQGVFKARNILKQMGIIDFRTNGNHAASYKLFQLSKEYIYSQDCTSESVRTVSEECQNGVRTVSEECQNSLPLIDKTKTRLDIDIKKEKNIKKEKADGNKRSYAEAVKLTEEEYAKLCQQNGEDDSDFADACIEKLNNYKLANKKNYASDYRAILSWVVGEIKQSYMPKPKKTVHVDNTPVKPRTGEEILNMSVTDLFLD